MADNSAIEWTDATWNPIVGCSILTPGCTNCYAMKMAARIQKMNRTGGSNSNYVNHYDGTTKKVKNSVVWTGKLALAPDKLFLKPLSRKAPTTYFVNSMGDLFHEDCPDEWIDHVFAVMALAPQHTFQVLTKRAARMRDYQMDPNTRNRQAFINAKMIAGFTPDACKRLNVTWNDLKPWPLPNVWLGVSTERQQEANERIPLLLQTPAAIRFISAEPLLGPITLHPLGCGTNALSSSTGPNLNWVIVGGESGPKARPMHPHWAHDLRDDCSRAGVPFFFKQWGEWAPGECASKPMTRTERCATWFNEEWSYESITPRVSQETHYEDAPDVYRLGKKAAGRHLDGQLHNGMPAMRA